MITRIKYLKLCAMRPVPFDRVEGTFTITTRVNRRIHSATTPSLPILTASNYHGRIQRGMQGFGMFLGSDDFILVSDYEATAPVSVSMYTETLKFIATLSLPSCRIPSAPPFTTQ